MYKIRQLDLGMETNKKLEYIKRQIRNRLNGELNVR